MQRKSTRPREVTLPATALVAIRRALAVELDGDAAARALQEAGCEAGHALFPALALDEDMAALPAHRFFALLDQLLASRGWGRLRHATPHPGVGELVGDAWLEADPSGSAGRPSCFLTTGLLTALLSRAVGQDVAVLEVACRSEGDDRCRFLFGAPQTLEALHRHLLEGDDAEAALAALV